MTSEQMQKKGYFSIFCSYYRPHIGLFTLDMVCAMCIAFIDLAFPLVSRTAMSVCFPENLYGTFFLIMAILVVAYCLKAAMYFIVTLWGHMVGVRIEADIRSDLFAHMQKLSFSFFDKNRTGQLMSRVTSDLFEITELAHHGPEDIFISVITIVGSFAIMLAIRWELALVLLVIIPIFLIFTVLQRKNMMAASRTVKVKVAGINEDLESSLSGMRTAKAFANESVEEEKFAKSTDQYRNSKRGYYKEMGVYMAGMEVFMSNMPVVVIGVGGFLFMEGKMAYEDIITFTLYVAAFITPLRKLASFSELFVQGAAGFVRFVDLMRTKPDIEDSPDATDLKDAKGDIDIEHVSFTYGANTEQVLEDVSLHIKAGETVAVVGPSGGGKSTLCQLIPRFYDVCDGSISVDGHDVRTLTQASLRLQIGIVQQDVFLFAGTIYENIAYGKPGATMEEVIEAAKKAEIYQAVMDMPEGFDTYVGERGVMLSGGQKQRISIARIFLKNPPILILDEATSALDSVTETRIQGAFDQLAKGRTTLIIAHRLSTIRSASRIIVIDGAGIIEQGSHQELVDLGGEYAKLHKAQAG